MREKELLQKGFRISDSALSVLQEVADEYFAGKPMLKKTLLRDGMVLRAYESGDAVIFVCLDRVLSDLFTRHYQDFRRKLENAFRKKIYFTHTGRGVVPLSEAPEF
jgi:hypothetical protein